MVGGQHSTAQLGNNLQGQFCLWYCWPQKIRATELRGQARRGMQSPWQWLETICLWWKAWNSPKSTRKLITWAGKLLWCTGLEWGPGHPPTLHLTEPYNLVQLTARRYEFFLHTLCWKPPCVNSIYRLEHLQGWAKCSPPGRSIRPVGPTKI